jgi:hypothetical protein
MILSDAVASHCDQCHDDDVFGHALTALLVLELSEFHWFLP